MTRNKVTLDHVGIKVIAGNGDMQRLCREAAERIADHIRGEGIRVGDRDGGKHEYELPVAVRDGVYNDRAFADVVINHPAGAAVQAKHGVLTRAASAEGLTVRG
jgi:hypothetical protein